MLCQIEAEGEVWTGLNWPFLLRPTELITRQFTVKEGRISYISFFKAVLTILPFFRYLRANFSMQSDFELNDIQWIEDYYDLNLSRPYVWGRNFAWSLECHFEHPHQYLPPDLAVCGPGKHHCYRAHNDALLSGNKHDNTWPVPGGNNAWFPSPRCPATVDSVSWGVQKL